MYFLEINQYSFIQHTIQPHCDLNLRKSHDVEKIVSAAQKHQLRTEQIDRAALKNQLLFLTQPLQYNIHHTMSSPNGSRMRIGQYNIIKSIGVGSFGKVKRKQIHSRLQSVILLLMLTNSTFLQWPFIQLRDRRLLWKLSTGKKLPAWIWQEELNGRFSTSSSYDTLISSSCK